MPTDSQSDALLARFPGPLTLYPSRWRWARIFLIGIVFVAGGIFMIVRGDPFGWLVTGFFGLGLIVAALMLLPGGGSLRLDRDGFETTSLYRRHRIRWQDASNFATATIGVAMRAQEMVVYDDVNVAGRKMAKLSVAIAGRNAGLPDSYGLPPAALAGLMTAWRAHAVSS